MDICDWRHSAIAYEGLSCPVCELRGMLADLEEKVERLWAMAEEQDAKKQKEE